MAIWKDIEGYEGLYQVSNEGEVKSKRNKIVKIELTYHGYCRVHLWKNGIGKHHSLHRLVAQAFIPNPNNLPQVNHKDEDKTNNHAENLEWCNATYNSNYGTRNQRVSNTQKGRVFTDEHKRNLSEALKTSERFQKMIHSVEYRQKLRDAQKNHPQRNRKDLSQQVFQYTLDGELVAVYPSTKQAARELNFAQCNISRACNGGYFHKGIWHPITQAYGFKWMKNSQDQRESQLP